MSERGTYVVLEGIDGTGKTELAGRLVPALLNRGHAVSSFREPTDRFLHAQYARLAKVDSFGAAMCLTVDRSLLRPEIERALEQGDVVVQDRSYYSTLAYQFPGLGAAEWRELERIEHALGIDPDLVLYLDAPVDLALERIRNSSERNPVDDEPYLARVRAKFEQFFQPPKWKRINATGNAERTLEQAMNALMASGL